jgi:hypothetical protein
LGHQQEADVKTSLERTLAAIDKVQNMIDVGSRLRAKLLAASGGADASPLEQEIGRLQAELEELTNYCATTRRNWTKMQNVLIKVRNIMAGGNHRLFTGASRKGRGADRAEPVQEQVVHSSGEEDHK